MKFRMSDGTAAPQLAAAKNEEAIRWGLTIWQDELVEFCRHACDTINIAGSSIDEFSVLEIRALLIENLRNLWFTPNLMESRDFGAFPWQHSHASDAVSLAAARNLADVGRVVRGPTHAGPWKSGNIQLVWGSVFRKGLPLTLFRMLRRAVKMWL